MIAHGLTRLRPRACRGWHAALSSGADQLFLLPHAGRLEETIKKSKFIAAVSPVSTVREAEEYIAGCRDPRATHTCWAYVVTDSIRCSDDGEPSGTAGRPMLAALTSENLTNVVATVTRYYGGINLGTGGLARAYGGAVAACLRDVGKVPLVPTSVVRVTVHFEQTPQVYTVLNSAGSSITKRSEDFLDTGDAVFTLEVPNENIGSITSLFSSATKGSASVEVI